MFNLVRHNHLYHPMCRKCINMLGQALSSVPLAKLTHGCSHAAEPGLEEELELRTDPCSFGWTLPLL
jgi:hypothetical protein